MKKLTLLFALLLTVSTAATAQKRGQKRTVKKPRTTAVAKPTAAKVNKNCAIYSFKEDIRSVRVTKDFIYYVETNDNNAVMAIDRKTGELKTIIPGIAGIYEGARQRIYSVIACGDRLFFQLLNPHGMQSNECGGIYVYDGKSVKTSLCLEAGTMIDGNDNYLLMIDCENGWEVSVSFWDVKTLKRVKQINDHSMTIPNRQYEGFIASNGNVWTRFAGKASCYTLNGKEISYSLEREPYVIQETQRGTYGSVVLGAEQLKYAGNYLYASCKRRIYRMNILSPGKWEEYAKMPATINNRFERFCPDANGNLLTQGVSNDNDNTLYWKVGSFDSPQPLGKDIKTGFNDWGYTKILVGKNSCMDADGNLVAFGSSSICIYNPNGVVGYTNAVGKIIKE